MDTKEGKTYILGIIPARGGSKSIPYKNIAPLAGKPLLHYMLTAALGSKFLSQVVVSSEDEKILNVAKQIGGEGVALKRPAELAKDDTPDVPMLQHAVNAVEKEKGLHVDYVVQLHATSPLFESHHIDEALKQLLDHKIADSIVSVYQVTNMHPKKLKRIVGDKLEPYIAGYDEKTTTRRQDMEPVFKRNAGLYAAKREVVMEQGRVWGDYCLAYLMPEEYSIDIDTPFDLRVVDLLIRARAKKI